MKSLEIIVAIALSSSSVNIRFHAVLVTFCGLHPCVSSCLFFHLHTVTYGQLYLADTSLGRKPLARSYKILSASSVCSLYLLCGFPKRVLGSFWVGLAQTSTKP